MPFADVPVRNLELVQVSLSSTEARIFPSGATRHPKDCISFLKLMCALKKKEREPGGVPWWLSRLRIWCCHCCGLGHHSGTGSIPGPQTSACYGHGQKKFVFRSSHHSTAETNLTRNHEDAGSIPGLT